MYGQRLRPLAANWNSRPIAADGLIELLAEKRISPAALFKHPVYQISWPRCSAGVVRDLGRCRCKRELTVVDLKKPCGERAAVIDVSFEVAAGEIAGLALIGPSLTRGKRSDEQYLGWDHRIA